MDLGVVPLKHEKCLYLGKYEGNQIICYRQSYDFLYGGEHESQSLTTHYNGIKIVQDRDYIHIHVTPYIDKILENHRWGEEGKSE
jgi:hypothetical protein